MQKLATVLVMALLLLPLPATALGQPQDDGRAYFDFGFFSFEDGDYQEAEANFLKALEIEPDNAFYLQYLAKTYLKMERTQEAMTACRKAMRIDPHLADIKYDMAYVHYKMSDYKSAGDLFSQIAAEEPANVLAHYHAGISWFKQNRFGRAVAYFLEAAELSPTVKTNGSYYAAICYQKTGQTQKALDAFRYVEKHAQSQNLRESAVKWIEAIEKGQKARKPYSLYLKVGGQYDDNVRLEPLDEDIYADEDDAALIGHFMGSYNVVNRQAFVLGAGYSHYQSWYDDLDEYDMTGSTLNVFARYQIAPLTLGLSFLPSYYWVDEDSYLRQYQLRPEVMWRISDDLLGRLSYRYNDKAYFDDEDRDGHGHEAFLDLYYNIFDKKCRLSGGIGYEDNDAAHPDYDYGEFKSRLGLSVDGPWRLAFSVTGKYAQKQYDSEDSYYDVERDDDKYTASASIARPIYFDGLRLMLEHRYTKNDSNIEDYDYERNVSTLAITLRY